MFVVNGTDLARSCNGQISEVRSPIFFPFLFFFFFFLFRFLFVHANLPDTHQPVP